MVAATKRQTLSGLPNRNGISRSGWLKLKKLISHVPRGADSTEPLGRMLRMGSARTRLLSPGSTVEQITTRREASEAASFSPSLQVSERAVRRGIVRIKRAKIDSIFLTAVGT